MRGVALACDLTVVGALLLALMAGAFGAVMAVTVAAAAGYLAGRWHGGLRLPRGH